MPRRFRKDSSGSMHSASVTPTAAPFADSLARCMTWLPSKPDDIAVQVAIATDIAFVSPQAFPGVAGILSHLISLAAEAERKSLWQKVIGKMRRMPHNGYLEVWLQRVTAPKGLAVKLDSNEEICKIADEETAHLWNNDWISDDSLKAAMDTSKIRVGSASEVNEKVDPEEVELFKQAAWAY